MIGSANDAPVVRFPNTRIGIVIKALNEAKNIRRAVESAQAAAPGTTCTVVLADSGSTDATVEIAGAYPIRIVQLAEPKEKSCGIGAQLGFQHLDCDYVYILDGDMELFPTFIPAAIAAMEADGGLAGVAGLVEEHGGGNYEFERRKATNDGLNVGEVESLDMGGLYRTSCVRQVGYLTNRNLHSYEEKELALRLRDAGYRLRRIAEPAVRHFGKTQSTGVLLFSRWRSRHLDGPGELLRSAVGKSYFKRCLSMFARPIAVVVSWLWLVPAILVTPWTLWPLVAAICFHILLFAYFLVRQRSFSGTGLAYINLCVFAASLARGLCRPQREPAAPIGSVVLR